MQPPVRHAILATLVAAGCAACAASTNTQDEPALRARLQAAHDATLRLEVYGRLDAAAIMRGVREVQAWSDAWFDHDHDKHDVLRGSVDASGTLSFAMPTIAAHDRCLTIVHLVDRAGVHWCCWLDLTKAPPYGRHDVGELRLQREPEPVVVVDTRGQPLAGARVMLNQQYLEEHTGFSGGRTFETRTDASGCAPLCHAAPFDAKVPTVVRHEDFAPWWGTLTSRVELDHGGEIRGRVLVPNGADPADFVVGVWVKEAGDTFGDSEYASVTAAIAPNGSYCLRNVPPGRRTVRVQDRHQQGVGGSAVEVDVGGTPTDAADLTLPPEARPSSAMRLRVTGRDGRAVLAPYATIHISDVGIRVPLHDGYLDWVGDPDEPFSIEVAGYGITDRTPHRTGDVFQLQGGYRVALRLSIDAARRLPPGCALRATVEATEPADADEQNWYFRERALYLDRDLDDDDESPLTIARDAPIVVNRACRYTIALELIRWDAAEGHFVDVDIDVEPTEFEVRAADEPTLVTVTSRFVEQK